VLDGVSVHRLRPKPLCTPHCRKQILLYSTVQLHAQVWIPQTDGSGMNYSHLAHALALAG
jgi:hypothetical protein